MKIDGCLHDFVTLSRSELPRRMRELEANMRKPIAMAEFAKKGDGVRTLLARYGHDVDFAGCYVLFGRKPVYVGISRKVFARLRQHVLGTTHFSASLAYRMAAAEAPHELTRSEAMRGAPFAKVFAQKRADLQKLRVAAVPIPNALERHLFEVYAAMHFKTAKWNTFETH